MIFTIRNIIRQYRADLLSNAYRVGGSYPGAKRPGREADHSTPSSAEVKNVWSYTSTPAVRLHDVVLNLAHGQFYLYLGLIY